MGVVLLWAARRRGPSGCRIECVVVVRVCGVHMTTMSRQQRTNMYSEQFSLPNKRPLDQQQRSGRPQMTPGTPSSAAASASTAAADRSPTWPPRASGAEAASTSTRACLHQRAVATPARPATRAAAARPDVTAPLGGVLGLGVLSAQPTGRCSVLVVVVGRLRPAFIFQKKKRLRPARHAVLAARGPRGALFGLFQVCFGQGFISSFISGRRRRGGSCELALPPPAGQLRETHRQAYRGRLRQIHSPRRFHQSTFFPGRGSLGDA